MDWKSFWDKPHKVYSGEKHLHAHYRHIADIFLSLLPGPHANVLDYGCGEALDAPRIAAHCHHLYLFEVVGSIRERVTRRMQFEHRISVIDVDGLAAIPDASVHLVVVNSVLQYLGAEELTTLLANARAKLHPEGRLIIADVIPPDCSALADSLSLLRFARRHGFLQEASAGLLHSALSDYMKVRRAVGLATYTQAALEALVRTHGFRIERLPENLGINPSRMTFSATPL